MGPQFDRNVTIADKMQVGVMPFLFGQPCNTIKELDGRNEMFGDPLSANANPVRGQFPARQIA